MKRSFIAGLLALISIGKTPAVAQRSRFDDRTTGLRIRANRIYRKASLIIAMIVTALMSIGHFLIALSILLSYVTAGLGEFPWWSAPLFFSSSLLFGWISRKVKLTLKR